MLSRTSGFPGPPIALPGLGAAPRAASSPQRASRGCPPELSHNDAAQELQEEAPELADATVERGRGGSDNPGEPVREEPPGIAQEGALTLHAPKLLEKRERDEFRARKPL